jgi:hypothetical protein
MKPEMKIKITLMFYFDTPVYVVMRVMGVYRRLRDIFAHAFNKSTETCDPVDADRSRAGIAQHALHSFTMEARA